MTSPRRSTFSIWIVVLAMTTILFSSVTAHLEQPTKTIELSRQARSPRVSEPTMRFLRTGGKGGEVANEVSRKEERGFLTENLISRPALKLGLRLTLKLNDKPAKILQDFQRLNVPMKEGNILLWMEYVQKYRTKMGGTYSANDAYVVQTLKEFIPESQLSVVFNAMKKKTKLRSFGIALENTATSSV